MTTRWRRTGRSASTPRPRTPPASGCCATPTSRPSAGTWRRPPRSSRSPGWTRRGRSSPRTGAIRGMSRCSPGRRRPLSGSCPARHRDAASRHWSRRPAWRASTSRRSSCACGWWPPARRAAATWTSSRQRWRPIGGSRSHRPRTPSWAPRSARRRSWSCPTLPIPTWTSPSRSSSSTRWPQAARSLSRRGPRWPRSSSGGSPASSPAGMAPQTWPSRSSACCATAHSASGLGPTPVGRPSSEYDWRVIGARLADELLARMHASRRLAR